MVEARGIYDFTATNEDELSFRKGDVLKIIDQQTDQHWYKAELNGRAGLVPKNYIQFNPPDWLDWKISREQAEELLLLKPYDGAFLVRGSESSPGDFTLSVKTGETVRHFKVLRDGAGKYFLWLVKFNSLDELIRYHRTSSVSRGEKILLQDTSLIQSVTVTAKFNFEGQDVGELSFKKGEIITVLDKPDENWWRGRCQGREGLFPATYVE